MALLLRSGRRPGARHDTIAGKEEFGEEPSGGDRGRERGCERRPLHRRARARRRDADRHRRGPAAGQGARHPAGHPPLAPGRKGRGLERSRGGRGSGRRGDDRRVPAQAGHVAHRPAQGQRRHRAARRRGGEARRAGRLRGGGDEPARRDGALVLEGDGVSPGARRGDGWDPGLDPLPRVPRGRARGLGNRRPGDGSRRPWRLDGAAAALHHRRRDPHHRAPPAGTHRRDRAADPRRGCRDRQAAEDRVGLLRSRDVGGRDGRGDPDRSEAAGSLFGAASGRVRDEGPVPRSPGDPRSPRRGEDRRARALG